MVDYSRDLLSYRFIYCKRAIPTPQSQEPCYYRIPDSFHRRYRRRGDLDVTLLCWPIAVALASSLDYGLNHCVKLNIGVFFCGSPARRMCAGTPGPTKLLSNYTRGKR